MRCTHRSLTAEQWAQAEELFRSTVHLTPAEQRAWLDRHCDDRVLREEVAALLRSDMTARDEIRLAIGCETVDFLRGADASGERLGAYRLLRRLEQGGMGTVYLAERADEEYCKQVAVKLLHNPLVTQEERQRFRTERQILANLEHPNIARLIDGGTRTDGSPYLVMEYIDGQPIDRYCNERRLSIAERLELFRQVCLAVDYAHRQRVVHRDLKPGNVLVTADGTPKLLDFGIAKLLDSPPAAQVYPLTRPWGRRLTPEYASPEQLSGGTITVASDVYALGVILYELITGARPHPLAGLDPDQTARIVCESDPLSPSRVLSRRGRHDADVTRLAAERRTQPTTLTRSLRGDLDNIVLKALRREPSLRYASAAELAQDVARYLGGEPVLARGAGPVYRLARFARRHRWRLLSGGALLTAFAAVMFYLHAVAETGHRVPALSATQASIAVLPFANESGDPEQEPLADGVTDDIITELAKVPDLVVIARDSSFFYKGRSQDFRELARKLDVRYFLEGSVRRAANQVRINTQLIDASNGERLWAERYDGDLGDIFSLPDRITQGVVSALTLKLTPAEHVGVAPRDTRSLKAYEQFLRGQQHFYRYSQQDNQIAKRYYEQALAEDPKFAKAYIMLARALMFDVQNGWSTTPERTLDRVLKLAERGIALDASIPEAYFVTGLAYRAMNEYDKALREAERAIALDPNYANAHVLAATLLYYTGRPAEGLERMKLAIRLHPLYPSNYPFHVGQAYYILKRYAEAIQAFRGGLQSNPTSERLHVWLAAAYAQSGNRQEAEWEVDQVLTLNPHFSLERIKQATPFKNSEDLERFLEGLRKAGFQ